jgi:hypothetical protein
MTCDWCEEVFAAHPVVPSWKLSSTSEAEGDEEFNFCCFTCVMRWVNA